MPQFTWVTWAQAKAALAARLAVPLSSNAATQFWTDTELGLYLAESLRMWNAMTAQANASFNLRPYLVANQTWYPLSGISAYPRVYSLTDSDMYTLMGYHLLENTASFSSQFSQQDFSTSLQYCRDQALEASAANLSEFTIVSSIGTRDYSFPDSTLAPIRSLYAPLDSTTSPIVLHREDDLAFEYFTPNWTPASTGTLSSYGVITSPMLGFAADVAPTVAGNFEFVLSNAGLAFNPPAATILGVPDDWAWVVKWGALYDLLSSQPEASDPLRAAYCKQRYEDGLRMMQSLPWLLLATIDGTPVDTPGVIQADQYSYGWDFSAHGIFPLGNLQLVVGGVDFVAPSPVLSTTNHDVIMKVVGNATIPATDSDFVQVSRDDFDVVLGLAEHIASFKLGGEEFQRTFPLLGRAAQMAMRKNDKLAALGLFRDVLLAEGQRQQTSDPRIQGVDSARNSDIMRK